MQVEAADPQEQVIEAGTPRSLPVAWRVEREAETASEGEAVPAVMPFGKVDEGTAEPGWTGRGGSAAGRGDNVGTGTGVPPSIGVNPRRRRTSTTSRQGMPAPSAPAE